MAASSTRTYIIPTLQALGLHALVIGLFVFNWESAADKSMLPPPPVVQAKVLSMDDPAIARKKTEAKSQAEAQRKATEQKKADEQRNLAEQKKADEQHKLAEQKKADEQHKLTEQKKADEQHKLTEQTKADEQRKLAEQKKADEQRKLAEQKKAEQLAARRETEMAQALQDEEAFIQDQQDRAAVQSYVGLIQSIIIQNWHRPLSARNGMQALLRVNLLPTGEVLNVSVIKGSGDAAFDRSAVQAVQRAEKFAELQQLSPRVFDAEFRSLKILFKPQDLDR